MNAFPEAAQGFSFVRTRTRTKQAQVIEAGLSLERESIACQKTGSQPGLCL